MLRSARWASPGCSSFFGVIDVFRALAACQGLELAGCGGVQGCFVGALATSNARPDLVVSRDEASGALVMDASSLALDKIRNYRAR